MGELGTALNHSRPQIQYDLYGFPNTTRCMDESGHEVVKATVYPLHQDKSPRRCHQTIPGGIGWQLHQYKRTCQDQTTRRVTTWDILIGWLFLPSSPIQKETCSPWKVKELGGPRMEGNNMLVERHPRSRSYNSCQHKACMFERSKAHVPERDLFIVTDLA
ncbi:hypothetical protein V6N13_061853 [Hibiscus sabdariffa]